jgi:[ribosomal protein S18]-alanine N-acetyltransferase
MVTASFGAFREGLRFAPMTEADVEEILGWRYAGELAVYGFDTPDPIARAEERRDLLDPANGYHAARTASGELVGFCCFGADAQVPGGDYREAALDVGLGLRPDLVGQGLGLPFVEAILDFARRELAPPGFRLTVAAFNRRAARVYEHAGFETVSRFERLSSDGRGAVAEFLVMIRPLESGLR